MDVTLLDGFWRPRQEQLRSHTLPVMLERLEAQGVVDNFRRVVHGAPERHQAMHFADSDLYKWLEAAILAGRSDLADPVIELVEAAQHTDGYLHTYYDTPGAPPRYTDLDFGHELYCFGHLVEAAVAHHETTGSDRLLQVARRLVDHVAGAFGPGRDERTDAHPEIELALGRLHRATGDERDIELAAWMIEQRLRHVGVTLEDHRLGGHAVRALYLASGIAEVALATGESRWTDTAARLFSSLVAEHSYPTGAVGGRWLGEAVGKPFELPDPMSYAESCAAVAAVQFCRRIWDLTGDPRALEQIELLLFNAVPCGVGSGGDAWFYSQPHAVDAVAAEVDPWVYGFEYGQRMLLEWFPARRHDWFLVPCCPPNLARLFATVDRHVAEVAPSGDLLVHLPVAARIRAEGWDVEISGGYPDGGTIGVTVHAAPDGREVRVRVPQWAGGVGHRPVPDGARVEVPLDWQWWETDPRVHGAAGTVFLRWGPVLHCVEGVDAGGVDLRDLRVDPTCRPSDAFWVADGAGTEPLHRPVRDGSAARHAVTVPTVPYATWANRGATTMRLRFPTA